MKKKQKIWRDLKGYEGIYKISNYGEVKSLSRYVSGGRHDKIELRESLRKWVIVKGYATLTLSKEGVSTTRKIHRLVDELTAKL